MEVDRTNATFLGTSLTATLPYTWGPEARSLLFIIIAALTISFSVSLTFLLILIAVRKTFEVRAGDVFIFIAQTSR
jgi:hypothetical protein